MPRYDYRCQDDACETDTFEVSKSYSDNSVTECPVCGSAAKKLLSPIAVHFKGSGFYSTDNRSSNGASSSDSDKSESKSDAKSKPDSDSKSGSGSKTESKTASSSKSSDSKSSSSKSTPAATPSKT
ncbi:MAG: zinc ribbon domain-containing protein [Chloroflexi bacterium]|nr:zinc ribbon domain-containing protein [Chloroflexota bacterium]MCH8235433.1 zinc ribbon domain-containing protein [Chloroflexota bacterium]MCH8817228.1 zinc ribbon domain-containing protein [Chloroflexota bacterium]